MGADKLLVGVCSLVLAGKADAKRRLLPELSQPLRDKVLCVIDLSRGANDMDALRQAAMRAGNAANMERRSSAESAVRSFLETVNKPDVEAGVLCCDGDFQTSVALAMGAVDMLLVAGDCASHGISRTPEEWRTHATV